MGSKSDRKLGEQLESRGHCRGGKDSANDAMRVENERCIIVRYLCSSSSWLMKGTVVAGYRLSWSCMQLAYVSTGSFISPGGRSLSGSFFQASENGSPSGSRLRGGKGGRPIAAAMPEEEEGFENIVMMCIEFSGYILCFVVLFF